MAQTVCTEKSNEITAIPEALKLVNCKVAIITLDALGCQKAIASLIVE
ncbi:transposase [Rubinisphaera italica]